MQNKLCRTAFAALMVFGVTGCADTRDCVAHWCTAACVVAAVCLGSIFLLKPYETVNTRSSIAAVGLLLCGVGLFGLSSMSFTAFTVWTEMRTALVKGAIVCVMSSFGLLSLAMVVLGISFLISALTRKDICQASE